MPCWSSWNPGASPTNISSASGLPEPKTTCVRPSARRQRAHAETTCSNAPSCWTRPSGSTAATRPAAASATGRRGTEGRLLGGAVSREHGQLPPHVRGAAVRAVGVVPVPDQLLEVRLAAHAHVLVDRHRLGSLGTSSDGRGRTSYAGRASLAITSHDR